jgi:hypothetical protein
VPHNCSIHCIVKLLKYIRYKDRQHENKKIFHDRTADQIDLSVPFLYHLFYVIPGISLIAFKSCANLYVSIIAFSNLFISYYINKLWEIHFAALPITCGTRNRAGKQKVNFLFPGAVFMSGADWHAW